MASSIASPGTDVVANSVSDRTAVHKAKSNPTTDTKRCLTTNIELGYSSVGELVYPIIYMLQDTATGGFTLGQQHMTLVGYIISLFVALCFGSPRSRCPPGGTTCQPLI